MRNIRIDLSKFACMVGVLLIHCSFHSKFGLILKSFCAFAVPLFFVWSGYFACKYDLCKIKRKVLQYLILLVTANLFYIVWDYIYIRLIGDSISDFFEEAFSIKKIVILLLFNESPFRGHLWFIGALLYCYVSLYIIRRMQLRNHVIAIIAAILLLFGIVLQNVLIFKNLEDKSLILVRNWIFDGLPFFLFGLLCKDLKNISKYFGIIKHFVIPVCILNILEIILVRYEHIYYVGTIMLVILSTLLILARENEPIISERIKILCDISKKYGLLFYILQVAVIKMYDLIILRLLGGIEGIVYKLLRPIILFWVVLLVSMGVRCLVNFTNSVRKK